MEMNAHGSCWAWQLEGGIGNLSLASSTRRACWWGGRQGCLRPSSRALRDDPSKPSIKVGAGGSTEMEERFHFPGTLYFDVNRHGCGSVAGSVRDSSFFLAVGMFLLKYGGNILPGEPGTQLAQKGENLRGKKIGVGQPINCQWREKAGKESSWLEPSRGSSVPERPSFCATLFQKPRSHWSSRREETGQPRWLCLLAISFLLPTLW